MPVDTAKVIGRRDLHFATISDIAADVERLAAGPIRTIGNWSLGQILWHLAKVMDDSIDGSAMKSSFFMRILGRLIRGRMLKKGMPAGIKLPPDSAAIIGPPATVTMEDGLATFRRAVARQQAESNRHPSPFFGTMSREQWEQLHCRHAELHLSFLQPAG